MSLTSGEQDDAVVRACEGADYGGWVPDIPGRGTRKGEEATDHAQTLDTSQNPVRSFKTRPRN
ncbi:MAG: hypothetical protein KTR25_17195 [Myxococcales bacterium]|nr:hypothetical protein [Myxococcales bacterium]